MISHWDELPAERHEKGHIAGEWTDLAGDRSVTIGVRRIRIDAGKWATPLHLEGHDEEIFFVVEGAGVSLQSTRGEMQAFPVRAGDILVHLALEHAHTLQGGPDGLVVLAFGQRSYAANTLLPRAGVSWLGPTWVLAGAKEDHPWAREAAVGPPEVGELSPRPAHMVNLDELEWSERAGATVAHRGCDPGVAAGSERTGLRVYDVSPGMRMNPPHVHSAEEEIYVVLAGTGELERWPHTRAWADPRFPAELERHALRAGSVACVPAGTGRPVGLIGGPEGMRVLAYGAREPNDICYYPRSGKISFRGVGVIGRLEHLPYWEGED